MSRDGQPRHAGQDVRQGLFGKRLGALAKEPLVHFFLIGMLLFAGYAVVGGPSDERSIRVDDQVVAALSKQFEATWQRPPTAVELRALVDSHVREEIFYREGIALGLDRDDPTIRRRVRQKFEVLAEENESAAPPTEAELGAWLTARPDRYAEPALITFEQILLDPAQHGNSTNAALQSARRKLAAGTAAADINASRMLPARFDLVPLDLIERDLGRDFARSLSGLRPGHWEGPVRSGFGIHLARVEKLIPGRVPPLDEVRKAVARDFEADRRTKAADATLRRLKDDYRIELTAALPAAGAE